jgi:dissimilatory sulfite reductase (desulfoviridin) alpha/beta subunit
MRQANELVQCVEKLCKIHLKMERNQKKKKRRAPALAGRAGRTAGLVVAMDVDIAQEINISSIVSTWIEQWQQQQPRKQPAHF